MMGYEIDQDSFDDAVASGVSLVDFWAEWCPPCRALSPVIDEVGAHFGDNNDVNVFKVDADENRDLASRFSITALPTLLIMKDGQVVERLVGMRSKEDLIEALERAATN